MNCPSAQPFCNHFYFNITDHEHKDICPIYLSTTWFTIIMLQYRNVLVDKYNKN
jgi:hypothetical protein